MNFSSMASAVNSLSDGHTESNMADEDDAFPSSQMLLGKIINACKNYPLSQKSPLATSSSNAKRPPGRPPKANSKSSLKEQPCMITSDSSQGHVDIAHLYDIVSQLASCLQETRAIIDKITAKTDNLESKLQREVENIRSISLQMSSQSDVTRQNPNNEGDQLASNIVQSAQPLNIQNDAMIQLITLKKQMEQFQQNENQRKVAVSGDLVDSSFNRNSNYRDDAFNLIRRIDNIGIEATEIESVRVIERNNKKKVLLKLSSSDMKVEMFRHFFRMERKPFYLNEVLTPDRAKLFYELRKLKKDNPNIIASAFTKNGVVCCRLSRENKVVKLFSIDDLRSLIPDEE